MLHQLLSPRWGDSFRREGLPCSVVAEGGLSLDVERVIDEDGAGLFLRHYPGQSHRAGALLML